MLWKPKPWSFFLKKHDYANSEFRFDKTKCSSKRKNDNRKLGEKTVFLVVYKNFVSKLCLYIFFYRCKISKFF